MTWFESEKRKQRRVGVPVGISDVRVARKDSTVATGQIVDLTPNGAKLSLDALLNYQEVVVVEVAMPMLDIATALTATVAWSKATPAGDVWLSGCSFNEPFEEGILDRLAAGGVIDRRIDARTPCDIRVEALWQLEDTARVAAIIDFSKGGFCLACVTEKPIGTKVHVRLASGDCVVGVVRWIAEYTGGQVFGCQFMQATRNRDANVLRVQTDVTASHFWGDQEDAQAAHDVVIAQ